MIRRPLALALPFWAAFALACDRGASDSGEGTPEPLTELTEAERSELVPDWTRYPEMEEGRIDTVDMRGEAQTGPQDGAGWHVHAINYAPNHMAITYTFFYTGPDSVAQFAADRQPRLVDQAGNVYEGQLVADNPRLAIEKGATGLGVFVFHPTLAPGARSLTLEVNDTTPPVLRIGPWSVLRARSDTTRQRIEVRSGEGG